MLFLEKLENFLKNKYIKLITTERKRNYLVSETNYHITNFLTEHLLAKEIKRKNRNRLIVYIKTDDVYKDIAEDVETRFDTSNYELDRPLPKAENKKVIGLMKDDLGGKIITKFVGLRVKTYSYLIDEGSEDKKVKGAEKCVMKRKLKCGNYNNRLEATQLDNQINYLGKTKLT